MDNILKALLFSTFLTISIQKSLDFSESDWPTKCKYGNRQSPIDIKRYSSETLKILNASPLKAINYKALNNLKFQLGPDEKTWGFPVVNVENPGNTVTFTRDGYENDFELFNIHYHIPSEHRINGKASDAEIHLVHMKKLKDGQNDGDMGNVLLVIGIMFKIEGSTPDPTWDKLNINKPDTAISNLDLTQWVKLTNPLFFYDGSLTTPKCDETVNWIVMPKEVKITQEQFDSLKSSIYKVYPNGNEREIQDLNGRKIWYYDGQASDFLESMPNFVDNAVDVEKENGGSYLNLILGIIIISFLMTI